MVFAVKFVTRGKQDLKTVKGWYDRSIVLLFSFSTMFLYSPAYLSEHVGHVHSTAGHCAVGVINGMMQHSWLLRLRPPHIHTYTHSAPPIFSFVGFPRWIMFWPQQCSNVSYTTAIVAAAAAQPFRHGWSLICVHIYVCVCTLHTTKTFGRFHTIFASQRPAAPRQSINLWNSLESQLWYLSP